MTSPKPALEDLRIRREDAIPRNSLSKGLILMSVAGLLLLCLGGFLWSQTRLPEVKVAIAVESVGNDSDRTVLNASGYVTARRDATVSSKVTGKIIEVLIEEGMQVESGQLLAKLDDSNVTASLRLAQAQVAAASAGLTETRVRLDEALREQRRITALANAAVASAADLDRAESDVRSLEAMLARQQREVEVSERQRQVWDRQLADTEIRAPFSGVVISKDAQPGEMISPVSAGGGFTRTGICTIVDMASLEIEVDVNEAYITRVQAGQPVTATLDAYADWSIPAKVIAIVPAADRQKATVRVRIGFIDSDPRMLPDMGVKVAFQESATESADARAGLERVVSVPAAAVGRDDSRDVVWVVHNSRIERRAVRVGNRGSASVTISAGLASGERVVVPVPGAGVFNDGQKVVVKP